MIIKKSQSHSDFKRVKPLSSGRGDVVLIQAFARVVKDILHSRGISIRGFCALLSQDGRINMTESNFKQWAQGNAHPKTYLYSLFVIADVLGLSLFDIITIHYPEEKKSIKAILRNPEYM
jgi:hypothetical protein